MNARYKTPAIHTKIERAYITNLKQELEEQHIIRQQFYKELQDSLHSTKEATAKERNKIPSPHPTTSLNLNQQVLQSPYKEFEIQGMRKEQATIVHNNTISPQRNRTLTQPIEYHVSTQIQLTQDCTM